MSNEIKTPWEFVEKYFPQYSSSNQIALANDLNLIISGEEIEEDSHAHELLQNTYNGYREHAQDNYNAVMLDIYQRAIEGYIEQTQNATE